MKQNFHPLLCTLPIGLLLVVLAGCSGCSFIPLLLTQVAAALRECTGPCGRISSFPATADGTLPVRDACMKETRFVC
jgi:hypothetical protein